MITPEAIVGFALGGALGSVWASVVLGRALRKQQRQLQVLLTLNDQRREHFKTLARNWLALARRVNQGDARVERVAHLLAELEVRDALAHSAEHVT